MVLHNLYRTHTRLPWRNWPRNKLTQPQSCSFWEGHQEHTLKEKTAHPTNNSGKTLRSSCRRGKLDASPSSCAKINSKQIKVLNLNPEVQPLLEENMRRENLKLEVEAKTSRIRIQAQEVIPRTDARDHMKWKCLHAAREMIRRERRRSEEREKTICQLHFLWQLTPRTHRELQKIEHPPRRRRSINGLMKWKGCLQRKRHKMPVIFFKS